MGFITRLVLLFFFAGSFLPACQGNPTRTGEADSSRSRATTTVGDVETLLAKANQAPPQAKANWLLQAAQEAIDLGDLAWARRIITNLATQSNNSLSPEAKARLALVKSRLTASEGLYPAALDYLSTPQLLQQRQQLPSELARAISQFRARLLFDMGQYAASAEERVLLHDLLSADAAASEENNQLLWRALMAIPQAELEHFAQITENRDLRGWYQLAAVSKDTQSNLREQLAQLDRWALNWPDHPASVKLPGDLQLLQQSLSEQPQQVALLLPFSGKLRGAAEAVRDGFMAAYYSVPQTEASHPRLRFYDTEQADINSLYDQAVADGAQLVIGPLAKEDLQELALRPGLPVPTLALNTIDNPLGVVPNLFQFGLGVEDEAHIAADRAWRDGHRRAMVFAPDSTLGRRSVDAFVQRWRALGGDLLGDYRFTGSGDYSKIVKQAMLLDQSEKRARDLRALVGNVEFEPRRRQDVDMIFLAAQPSQARLLKPTLAFHYAADVPVYATSHVYTGFSDPKLDQDLNGIKFSTLPWYFERQSPEKKALGQFADSSPNLQPLYALGVDCFHLYPRLKQLAAVHEANFYGHTGRLQLNEQNQFQRQQVWAEFNNGRARLLAESL